MEEKMVYEYIFHGEVVPKKNSRVVCRKSGKSFPNKRYIAWQKEALVQIARAGKPQKPIALCNLTLTLYHADNRGRDADNALSSVLDALVDAGVIEDDRWQVVRAIKVENKRSDSARCVVKIDAGNAIDILLDANAVAASENKEGK